MRTPISYYGGKQSMLKHILPMIPEHAIYAEPFFGGGAVFFAKKKVKVEVINDFNGNVINFYEQLRSNFDELKTFIDVTLYSRDTYKRALTIYNHPYLFTPVHRAWAFWVATIQGFSNMIGSWHSSNTHGKEAGNLANRKLDFTRELSERLIGVQIENRDAVEVIKIMDTPNTFFYIDPPYVGANQGHYYGYKQEHFNELLEALSNLKGKFILSSYPNEQLNEYRVKYGWNSKDVSVGKTNGTKVEALTFNFDLK